MLTSTGMPAYRLGDRVICPSTVWGCQLLNWCLERLDLTKEEADYLISLTFDLEGEDIVLVYVH